MNQPRKVVLLQARLSKDEDSSLLPTTPRLARLTSSGAKLRNTGDAAKVIQG